jgi:hypothetical protein
MGWYSFSAEVCHAMGLHSVGTIACGASETKGWDFDGPWFDPAFCIYRAPQYIALGRVMIKKSGT